MGGFELIFFSEELFAAKVRAEIVKYRSLAIIFLTLFCFSVLSHYLAVEKKKVLFNDSWPFLAVELVLAVACILFFVFMRQWQDFLKRNCKAISKPQGGLEIMSTGKAIGLGIVALLVIFAIGWAVQGNDFFMYKIFAPQYEQVRHDTFKNSQAYTDGKVQELQQYMLEYNKALPEHKAALKTVIVRESAKVDESYLPSDLRAFISRLKNETAPAMSFK